MQLIIMLLINAFISFDNSENSQAFIFQMLPGDFIDLRPDKFNSQFGFSVNTWNNVNLNPMCM